MHVAELEVPTRRGRVLFDWMQGDAWRLRALVVLAVALSGCPAWPQDDGAHLVPMFPGAGDGVRQGFVRVINHSPRDGEVQIQSFDDGGVPFGPVTLAIHARETVHFNSTDLAEGNPAKGLSGGVGSGGGDWRLTLSSDLDIEVLSYVRTPADGFVTSMHDLVPLDEHGSHRVATFNPGSNRAQESRLRLINPGERDAEVTIAGTDDTGASPGGAVRLTLPAGASRTIEARGLESGAAALAGALGDGEGKWRLTVDADRTIHVMSLLRSPAGHLTNLSTVPPNVDGGVHDVPLFPAASDPSGRQGFVRVINRSAEPGEVTIDAFDDTDRDFGTSRLVLDGNETVHFNSDDLEMGNPGKGLTGGTGAGAGDWRPELTSDLDIEVLAYVRHTRDGFLTAMHDTVTPEGDRHRVAIFNPGANVQQASRLRLVNAGDEAAEVRITGIDDRGRVASANATVTVPAGASRTLSAQELEAGGEGFAGELGNGVGKWRLVVESDRPVTVMSLLASPTGHLTNLSTAPSLDFAPADGTVFDDRLAGGRIATADPERYFDFSTPGRFRETRGAEVREGDYAYTRSGSNRGPNRGAVVFNYDDGGRCTAEMTFRSRTAGQWTLTCDHAAATGSWTLDARGGRGSRADTDLLVEFLAPDDPVPLPGAPVTLGATVRNRGTETAPPSTLRFYRSSNPTVSTGDAEVGAVGVPALPPAGVDVRSIDVAAPDVPGTYYFGACVDNEADEARNACSASVAVTVAGVGSEVVLPDANLRGVVAHVLGKGPGDAITVGDMLTLRSLDFREYLRAQGTLHATESGGIRELEGLQFARGLEHLNVAADTAVAGGHLHLNAVSDLSPLSRLTNLVRLDLGVNNDRGPDLSPLSGLRNLEALRCWNCGIADLAPLANLKGLASLSLYFNRIADLTPLSALRDLRSVYLSGNAIEDVQPLAVVGDMTLLRLESNRITDISSLANLKELRVLSLADNGISDVSALSELTALHFLGLSRNRIRDISPLAGLTNMDRLWLGSNPISSVAALSEMRVLRELYLESNDIEDLSPLAELTSLKKLRVDDTPVADIGALAGLIEVTDLRLRRNRIVDISPLRGLRVLRILDLRSNRIAGIVALEWLTELERLVLADNRIVDLAPLAANEGLGAGDRIDLRGNPLSEDSLETVVPILVGRGAQVETDGDGATGTAPDP